MSIDVRRRLPRKIAFTVALSAVVLCLAEVSLRWLAPIHFSGIRSAYVYDDKLGVRLADGLKARELSDHLQEMRSNRAGTANFQESFEAYGSRIFAIGDSYTQGTGLPPDASYPFQLDLQLNIGEDGQYQPNYAVVNLGLAAYGAEQSLIALRRYTERLGAPGVCLYLGAENDFTDDVLFRSGYRHRHIVRGSPHWGWMVEPLLWAGQFEIVKHVKIATSRWRRRGLLPTETSSAKESPRSRASVAERTWPVVNKILSECQNQGAVTIVSWSSGDSSSYAWLQARATVEGIGFADWWRNVESVRQSMPEIPLSNPHSGGHLRTWVNRLIADAFARQIKHAESGESHSTP
jgi:hypothetical protein